MRAIATPHRLSALAGREIIEKGGNAVDAAIAAVAVQGVVAPETCGLGGDLFALVHRRGWDKPRALNASGRAGSGADPEELRRAGLTEVPRDHPLTVTVPGCVDGLFTLGTELGGLAIEDSLATARSLAEVGFEVTVEQERAFTALADVYRGSPAVSSFYPGGRPVRAGVKVRRTELAETFANLMKAGRDSFYRGQPAEDIVAATGGRITLEDLSRDHAEWVEPIGVELPTGIVWTTPPNSQGYLGPASLAVFEMLEPPSDPEDPLWWHLLIESYRCLAWERNDLVADPDHLALPADHLLDSARLQRAAETVDHDRTGIWPRNMGAIAGTAYLCVSDGDLAVSVIQSNYRGTGSVFGAFRSGFLLQDRGGGFGLVPGHPNELGPGKRPLHTLSPTLWTSGDHTTRLLGTRGGAIQPQLVAQVAARLDRGGDDIADAQAAPRWSIFDFGPESPSVIRVEPEFPTQILAGLEERGHRIDQMAERQPGWGPVSLIELGAKPPPTAPDPRVDTTTALVF